MMRVVLCSSFALGSLACRSSSQESQRTPPAAEVAPEGESLGSASGPQKHVVEIEASSLRDIEVHQLVFSDEDEFVDRPIGQPTLLLEAPHLELSRDAVSPTRGFVHIVDGPKWPTKTLESRLIDFESGEVLRVRRAYNGQYRMAGVAMAEAVVDGIVQEVLVHLDDGQLVPWRNRFPEKDVEIAIAGPNDAWIFVNDDAPPSPATKTRYVHWTDLRTVPPNADRELPWYVSPANRFGKFEGPSLINQVQAPIVVRSRADQGDCTKTEMMPDGSHECRPADFFALTDGWRVWNQGPNGTGEAFNVQTGEVQRLAFAENCVFFDEPTLAPPRALVACAGTKDKFIWSPDGAVRVPQGTWRSGFGQRSWDSHTIYAIAWDHDLNPTVQWLDLVSPEVVSTEAVNEHLPYGNAGTTIVNKADDRSRLYFVDFDVHRAMLLRSLRGCAEYGHHEQGRSLHVYSCKGGNGARWTEVVDYERRSRFRLPALQLRVWIDEPSRIVVGIHDGKRDRVLLWRVP